MQKDAHVNRALLFEHCFSVGCFVVECDIGTERLDVLDLVVRTDLGNDLQAICLGKLYDNAVKDGTESLTTARLGFKRTLRQRPRP